MKRIVLFGLTVCLFLGSNPTAADVINGRWVTIPHCDVDPGTDCDGEEGWPWVEAQHTTLDHTGKLLIWKSTLKPAGSAIEPFNHAHYWDPSTAVGVDLAATGGTAGKEDANCAGHLTLADGRILVVGGWDRRSSVPSDEQPTGINTVWLFDPSATTPQLVEQTSDPMSKNRWYGTPTILSDGDVVVIGGGEHWDSTAACHRRIPAVGP